MKAQPLKFEELHYDPHTICWGLGNDIVGPQILARIQLREPTRKEDKKLKADYEKAKELFNKYVQKGMRFKPSGDDANKEVTFKITYIHNEKQSITWLQEDSQA